MNSGPNAKTCYGEIMESLVLIVKVMIMSCLGVETPYFFGSFRISW
jgi:hypothetical protein